MPPSWFPSGNFRKRILFGDTLRDNAGSSNLLSGLHVRKLDSWSMFIEFRLWTHPIGHGQNPNLWVSDGDGARRRGETLQETCTRPWWCAVLLHRAMLSWVSDTMQIHFGKRCCSNLSVACSVDFDCHTIQKGSFCGCLPGFPICGPFLPPGVRYGDGVDENVLLGRPCLFRGQPPSVSSFWLFCAEVYLKMYFNPKPILTACVLNQKVTYCWCWFLLSGVEMQDFSTPEFGIYGSERCESPMWFSEGTTKSTILQNLVFPKASIGEDKRHGMGSTRIEFHAVRIWSTALTPLVMEGHSQHKSCCVLSLCNSQRSCLSSWNSVRILVLAIAFLTSVAFRQSRRFASQALKDMKYLTHNPNYPFYNRLYRLPEGERDPVTFKVTAMAMMHCWSPGTAYIFGNNVKVRKEFWNPDINDRPNKLFTSVMLQSRLMQMTTTSYRWLSTTWEIPGAHCEIKRIAAFPNHTKEWETSYLSPHVVNWADSFCYVHW